MNSRSFHFTGIAGSGMNPLAQAALHCGHRVTGSDRYFDSGNPLPVIAKLQKKGIRFFPQDGSGITPKTDTLIVSTAVESDNPDLLEAKRLGIAVLHRAELLEQLCRGKTVIAVAGTAGKTTVTAMLGFIAEQLGLDPAVYTGAPLIDWRSDSAIGNFRGGKSDLWIIETDESDRSFLRFHPEHSIVTNISKDHFELDELHSMFNRFRSQTRGSIIEGETLAPYSGELSMPGRHNRLNAACALALADALGWNRQQAEAALKNFQGIERRLELTGHTEGGAAVFDDFAHNPLKIEGAWNALSEKYPEVIGVWRPHGFGPLRQLKDELTESFRNCCRPADRLFILPVYYVGGSTDRSFTAEQFTEQLQEAGLPAQFADDYDKVRSEISEMHPGRDSSVLIMGARDPGLPQLARSLTRIAGAGI